MNTQAHLNLSINM